MSDSNFKDYGLLPSSTERDFLKFRVIVGPSNFADVSLTELSYVVNVLTHFGFVCTIQNIKSKL